MENILMIKTKLNNISIVPEGTAEILSYQFSSRNDLIDVVIPKSVIRLGAGAFYNCPNLKSVIFEEDSCLKYIDNSVFQNCKKLEVIDLPKSVVHIHAHSFWNCINLPSTIALPNSLQEIETTAYYNTKIMKVILPKYCKYQAVDHGFPYAPSFPENCDISGGIPCNFYSLFPLPLPKVLLADLYESKRLIEDDVESSKYIVPFGTAEIENNKFSERQDIVDIIIPKSVRRIGANAFYFCSNLRTVKFEKGSLLRCIDYFTFQNCFCLEKIDIPEGVIQIKAHSFWSCYNLQHISFPNSLETIDASSFFITKLDNVKLPCNCKYQVKGHCFPYEASFKDGCIIEGGIPFNFYKCRPFPMPPLELMIEFKNPEYVTITESNQNFIVPQGTAKIESNQFCGRKDIVDIFIPKSVQTISSGAFYLCTNLNFVVFEEGSLLKLIDSYAFQNCHSLESINIPDGVLQIRSHAFWACPKLSSITFSDKIEIIDCSAFYTTKIRKVSLPINCKYQGKRHGFPHEKSFPEDCVVTGGISLDLYEY
jgi:hypothetical protein